MYMIMNFAVCEVIVILKTPFLPASLDNKRQRIAKGQYKMDNPEKLATQGTQNKTNYNTRLRIA